MASAVLLTWVSAVVRPNQTLVASGSGFVPPCMLELNHSSASQLLPPLSLSAASIMATLPADVPPGPATLRVGCGAAWSNPLAINTPRVWWVQGSCGNSTVPGGRVRVFGDALSTLPATEPPASRSAAHQSRRAALEARAADALSARDYSTLAAISDQLAKVHGMEPAVPLPRLRLQREGSSDALLTAKQSSVSQYHAEFTVPYDIPAGEYAMSFATDATGEWIGVDYFESASKPHVTSLSVRTAAVQPIGIHATQSFQTDTVCEKVPDRVFSVADFGPTHIPADSHHSGTLSLSAVDASAALTNALAAAKSHGGGTVYFPRGQYFLRGSFDIPTSTYLKGAGTSLVSLYWAEANHTVHPRALFMGDPTSTTMTWGLSDITIYATAYYYNLIIDGNTRCTDGPEPPWSCRSPVHGFTMLRVRIRANAYFGSVWGPYSSGNRARPNVNFNFSQGQLQGVLMLTGANWRVSDCDILGTGSMIWSGGSGGGYGGTAYGELSRNRIRNGGNALAMDQWKQVVVEDNQITGASLAAAGNNIATYVPTDCPSCSTHTR